MPPSPPIATIHSSKLAATNLLCHRYLLERAAVMSAMYVFMTRVCPPFAFFCKRENSFLKLEMAQIQQRQRRKIGFPWKI
jgi:hypothetical protein